MKVRAEDILKPGAVLKVELINWSDPEVKRRAQMVKEQQLSTLSMNKDSKERRDKLRNVINI